MKNKIIVAAGAVLLAAAVVASIYENDGKIKGDQLLLNEVEALASGESSGDVIKCWRCNKMLLFCLVSDWEQCLQCRWKR